MAEPLLSDLCKICNTHNPKYHCPRCGSRTCSLPCYKRHQKRSQCSGKRDPAAYVKPTDLATPAGIDRDFNFLTGIERALDKADQAQAERAGRPGKESVILQRSLYNRRVTVHRAPLGLSRHKENRTRWNPIHGHIIWTVEWLHPDGARELEQCTEHQTLTEIYGRLPSQRSLKKKRKLEDAAQQQPKAAADSAAPSQLQENIKHEAPVMIKREPADLEAAEAELPHYNQTNEPQPQPQPHEDTNQCKPQDPCDPTPSSTTNANFYLLKPLTTGRHRVLIPLPADTTLARCLTGQIVLEFPTIHVLPQSPERLPDGSMLEPEYFELERRLKREVEAELPDRRTDQSPWRGFKEEQARAESVAFDEQSITESLRRDATRLGA